MDQLSSLPFGEFEPFVDCTYKYFAETLLHDHSLPYHIKQPLFWSDEFINWEEKTKEKELRPNDWISVIDGKSYWAYYWREFKHDTRNFG